MALRSFIPDLFGVRGWPPIEAILQTTLLKEDLAYDGYAFGHSCNLVGVHLG
jgi:hypothetical protein